MLVFHDGNPTPVFFGFSLRMIARPDARHDGAVLVVAGDDVHRAAENRDVCAPSR
jgi:hypothetical protein